MNDIQTENWCDGWIIPGHTTDLEMIYAIEHTGLILFLCRDCYNDWMHKEQGLCYQDSSLALLDSGQKDVWAKR